MFKALILRVWGVGVKCLTLRVRSLGAVSVVGVEVACQGEFVRFMVESLGLGLWEAFHPPGRGGGCRSG